MSISKEEIMNREYFPYIHRVGRVMCTIGILANLLPAILLYVIFGVAPSSAGVIQGMITAATVLVPFYIIEPLTYFTVIGIAGTYLLFAGNGSNCRVPCAAVSLESLGVKEGTPEAEVISNLAVATSVWVNTAIVFVGCIAGAALLMAIPPFVRAAFDWILPAIFGVIYAQFTLRSPQYSAVVIAICLILHYAKVVPGWSILPIVIVASLGFALYVYRTFKKAYAK